MPPVGGSQVNSRLNHVGMGYGIVVVKRGTLYVPKIPQRIV